VKLLTDKSAFHKTLPVKIQRRTPRITLKKRLTPLNLSKPPIISFLISILLVGLTLGCSTTQERKLKNKGLTLMYKPKSIMGSELADIRLVPIQISVDEVRQQLRSLKYEELSLFGKKQQIFTRSEIKRIEGLITKALNRVSANKIVYYELETSGGTTVGDIFVSPKVLNWRFSSIRGMKFSAGGVRGSSWRMSLGSGQKYHAIEKMLGSVAKENWIEVPHHPETKSSVTPARPLLKKETSNSAIDPELEKKLQFLKRLYENKLIDKKEYHRKRKELLDKNL
jgi:hypothetical protein